MSNAAARPPPDGTRTMNVIEQLEREQIAKLTANREIPEFAPGDTVRVSVRVTEGP